MLRIFERNLIKFTPVASIGSDFVTSLPNNDNIFAIGFPAEYTIWREPCLASENAAKKDTTEAEGNTRDILAVCDSLNSLHLTLHKLSYAVDRITIVKSLSEKKPFVPENNPTKKPDYKRCVILIVLAAVLITVVSLLFLNQTLRKTARNHNELLYSINENIRLTVIIALIAIVTSLAAIFIVFRIINRPADQGSYGGKKTPKKYYLLQRSI